MRRVGVLGLPLLLSSCLALNPATCAGTGGGRGYSYLVTPDGQMFRMRSIGPVFGAGQKRLGTKVSYAGEHSDLATIRAEAETLARALGPELAVAGEKALMVETTLGYDPGKTFSSSTSYVTTFERTGAGWVRNAGVNDSAEKSSIGGGSTKVAEDQRFPFDRQAMLAARRFVLDWVRLLDEDHDKEARLALAEKTRDEVDQGARWFQMVSYRRGLGGGTRAALYELQTRQSGMNAVPAMLFQFEFTSADHAHLVETVTALQEQGTWKVAGYLLRPIPGG